MAIGASGDGLAGANAGRVLVYSGASLAAGTLYPADADRAFAGSASTSAGSFLSAADLDLDGADDLLIRGNGAPGRLWVVPARP